MKILKIDNKNQRIKVENLNKFLPRSVSVIEGNVKQKMNSNNEIILTNVKFGVVTDKQHLKIKFADFKDKEIKIILNQNNIIFVNENEKLRLEFSILKQIEINNADVYEKTYKEAVFKFKIIK